MTEKSKRKSNEVAPALSRGLAVLEFLHSRADGESLSDVAATLRLPKNSVLRLLNTLEDFGYVEREADTLRYRITRRVATLFMDSARDRNLMEAALPSMRSLRDRVNETVLISIIERRAGIVLEQVQSTHPFRFVCESGTFEDLHSSASTKAILAFLPQAETDDLLDGHAFTRYTDRTITRRNDYARELAETRERGYATDRGEQGEGVCCVAAPVFDRTGRPLASITVTGPAERFEKLGFEAMGKNVTACAQTISALLGYIGNDHHSKESRHERKKPCPPVRADRGRSSGRRA
jgi:DNA-binding IclR family transcriptional regulator